MSGDSVAAVLSAWGPGLRAELAPTIEAAAAMLARLLGRRDRKPDVERFPTLTPARPNARLRRVLDSLLMDDSIAAAVQPIVRLHDGSVIGYEALARFPARGPVRTPDDLFASASSLNMQNRVDLACLRAALAEAPKLGEADLFVNVLIGTLLDRTGMAALNEAVREAGVDPESVVLEFSEREPVTDLARLQRIAAEVRSSGFRIAVDDAGAGHASMRVIAELRPEFIKVDRSLIHAVDSDRARQGAGGGAPLLQRAHRRPADRRGHRDQGGGGDALDARGHVRPGLAARNARADRADRGPRRARGGRRGLVRSPARVANPRDPPARRGRAGGAAVAAPRSPPSLRGRGLPRALSSAALALQNEHDPVRIVGVMAELMSGVVPVSEMAIFAADYETHRMVPDVRGGHRPRRAARRQLLARRRADRLGLRPRQAGEHPGHLQASRWRGRSPGPRW